MTCASDRSSEAVPRSASDISPARRARACEAFCGPRLASWALLVGSLAMGCNEQTLQSIEGLTVIAVEATPPTARPGDTVELEMTYFDPATLLTGGAEADAGTGEERKPPQIVWFGGCHNPPGETATGCLPLLGEAAAVAASLSEGADPEALDPERLAELGLGPRFQVQIPNDSITGRERRPNLVPFGVSYVFFAVCRGELTALPEARERLPVGCVDDTGADVAEDDFVIGYTTIYVFEDIRSESPGVSGLLLNGERIAEASCEENTDCRELGDELSYSCRDERCLPRVAACDGACRALSFEPIVDSDAAELDTTTAPIGRPPQHELVWVKYYAVGGLDRLESLVFDRDGSRRESFAAEWTPPRRGGFTAPLFAVVQDSRGGTTPVRADVWIEN